MKLPRGAFGNKGWTSPAPVLHGLVVVLILLPSSRARAHEQAKPAPVAAVPQPPRASVEMIEGAKKRNVDFP